MSNAPATAAVVDKPNIASIDLRRKRRRDKRCFAISAASAPPPCSTSYCWGVIGALSGSLILISHPLVLCQTSFQMGNVGRPLRASGSHRQLELQIKVDVCP